jgi:flagellar biosynthetic protein FliQ
MDRAKPVPKSGIASLSNGSRSPSAIVAARKEGCQLFDVQEATDLVRQSLVLALLIASPMLVIGMLVGIVISLFQAVTQIQEQTLTFVPKIAAMIIAAVVLMP